MDLLLGWTGRKVASWKSTDGVHGNIRVPGGGMLSTNAGVTRGGRAIMEELHCTCENLAMSLENGEFIGQ